MVFLCRTHVNIASSGVLRSLYLLQFFPKFYYFAIYGLSHNDRPYIILHKTVFDNVKNRLLYCEVYQFKFVINNNNYILIICFTPLTFRNFLISCSNRDVSSTFTVRLPLKSPS